MIISHRHRFIFVAIPKTGTHSVRRALRAHLADDDLEQVGLFVNKRFPFSELESIGHGHITLQQVRPHMEASQFQDYYKFAFIRNPYDRFVSYCAFMSRKSGRFAADPRGFMKQVVFDVRPMEHVLYKPQHYFLVDVDGRLLTDYVGRVENMQASYDAACARLGLPSTGLERVNGSSRGDYREYYDAELLEAVSALYAVDLEMFGYAFD